MEISLITPGERNNHAQPLSERILYHFSLDRSFSRICADVKKREHFLTILSDLTDDSDEILYRQKILKDFESNPDLLEQLASLSSRFEELRLAQKSAGKDEFRLNTEGTESAASSKNILQIQAVSLKRALLFVQAYGELLSKFQLHSEGLNRLYVACKETYEHPDFERLISFCSKYERLSTNGYVDFKLELSYDRQIKNCTLIDHRYIHVTEPEAKKKGFFLRFNAVNTLTARL